MTGRQRLDSALGKLRAQYLRRRLAEGAVVTVGAVLVALLLGAAATSTMGMTAGGVLVVRLVGYALVAAAIAWGVVVPLVVTRDERAFANYLEVCAPELKQGLLTAMDAPSDGSASPSLLERVIDRVESVLAPLARTGEIERPREKRAAIALASSAGALALMLAFGPAALRDAARVLFTPWTVAIAATPPAPVLNVEPGDVTVARGGALDIHAELRHFSAAGAELVFRADSAAEWIRLPMGRNDSSFVTRLFDIVAPTEYYVEANGVRSLSHRIRVDNLPAVSRIAVELRFPAYTGKSPEITDDGGDIAAVVGTTAIVQPTVTMPVREGSLVFDDGTSVPLAREVGGTWSASFRVRKNGFYRVDLVATDGRAIAGGVQYAVEAIPDRLPDVRITTPGRDTKVGALDEVTIEAVAEDDHGVRGIELRFRVNGGNEQRIALRPPTAPSRTNAQGVHTILLEELPLKPGDLIAYHAAATDGAGQTAQSDIYFFEVRPWARDYRQAEAAAAPGGQGEAPEAGDFVKRQREIVAGTYNSLRDSASRADRQRVEDFATLAIAQGQLREEVTSVATRLGQRGIAASDTTFGQIKAALDSAALQMKDAEEQLGRRAGRTALPYEERALAFVQRADALYREVQLQQQSDQPPSGGGGEQPEAEDLADLFELETDRTRNQYEAVQQQSSASADRPVDEVLERLRQLASRQQQENERAQRQAEAMRDRMGRSASGGGGGSQRDLARQAEEEARRLERLSRERESEELAEAARQMQRAADAMRQAATGSEAQGASALEQLERAMREVEDARQQGIAEEVRELSERANRLEREQRAIADAVRALPAPGQPGRGERMQQLAEQKDALGNAVERMEADADRLSRESRREQPGASARMRDASSELRDQRVRDKLQFSKRVMQGGSPEYASAFEEQITSDIAEAAESMREAVGALQGESAARQQERALQSARDLVRGLESLQERTGEQGGQQPGQQPGQQSGQQPGQQSGQQPGQQSAQQPGQQSGQQPGQQPGAPTGEGPPTSQNAPAGRLTPGDARQLAREFGLRRQNAEQLRDLARAQGADVSELERAIRELRQLENARALNNPALAAALQASALERLKAFEFALQQRLLTAEQRRGAVGARSPVPSEYRAEVEEYYRSLARPPRP